MGGENELLAHALPGGVGLQASLCLGQQFGDAEHGVAFVEVVNSGLDAHCPQRPQASHAQHRVLGQPDRAVALVQPRRHPAADLAVVGQVGV